MADIFISYKREDRPTAERLALTLGQMGFSVWWDFELLSGDRYRRAIEEVISKCSVAIVLWSQLSRDSGFVLDEASYANDLNKLCPARIDDCRLPLGFGSLHTDDLRKWNGEADHLGLEALVRSLENRIGHKAKIGAKPDPDSAQIADVELEDFKAVQLAGSVENLQSFLRAHPRGTFADFVRGQLEQLEDVTLVPRGPFGAPSQPAVAPVAGVGRAKQAARSNPWPLAAGSALVVVSAAIGLIVFRGEAGTTTEATRAPMESASMMQGIETETLADPARDADAEIGDAGIEEREDLGRNADKVQASSSSAQFDLAQLPNEIRSSVEAARQRARDAETFVKEAEESARLAKDAAQRALAGSPNTYSGSVQYVGQYQGESHASKPNGHGIASSMAGGRTVSYEGEWQSGFQHGLGIRRFSSGPYTQYAGQFDQGDPGELGKIDYRAGGSVSGEFGFNGRLNGYAVATYSDGSKYEGRWVASARHGPGVLWDASGRVSQMGEWYDDKLTNAAP